MWGIMQNVIYKHNIWWFDMRSIIRTNSIERIITAITFANVVSIYSWLPFSIPELASKQNGQMCGIPNTKFVS